LDTGVAGAEEDGAEVVAVPVGFWVVDTVLGAPKKDVMLPFALGFLASEVGRVEALRLRDMVSVRGGQRRKIARDSLVLYFDLKRFELDWSWFGRKEEVGVDDPSRFSSREAR
jgi:hypothetical protein